MREIIQRASRTARPRKQDLKDGSMHICLAASLLHCSPLPKSQIVYLYLLSHVILTKSQLLGSETQWPEMFQEAENVGSVVLIFCLFELLRITSECAFIP